MARININLPESFDFSTEVQVCIGDVNAGNHLATNALLSYLNEGLVRWLEAKGFPKAIIDGCSVIAADQAMIYKSEAFHGDTLRMEIGATDFHKHGCDLVYRVTEKGTGREIAVAKTGLIFFEYYKREIVAMPAAFKSALGLE